MNTMTIAVTGTGTLPPFTLSSSQRSAEASRYRETLLALRPADGRHDHLCEQAEGSPDVWLDESDDPPVLCHTVVWVPGQGYVTDDRPSVPCAGWCCAAAHRRQTIDAALADPEKST